MSVRLVILGLLRERPLYGYEIKQIIESHMSDWTSIAFGSIYFALDKLEEEGFIEKIGVEQEGKRPSRRIYQVTSTGREEFMRLLHEVWKEVEHPYYTIDIGLAFMTALPAEEIKSYLQKRLETLEGILAYLDTHQAETMAEKDTPFTAAAIFEHSRVHYRSELAWTRDLLTQLEAGK